VRRSAKATMRDLLTQNPYTPPVNLVRTLTTSFPLFEELLIIRDWLQDIAPCPPPMEATTGYWKFTKHSVLQSLRMGNDRDGLIRQMDPDAVNRGDQKMLASEDAVCCLPCLTDIHESDVFPRFMRFIWFITCMASYVLASCVKLLKRVGRHISRGALPAFEALYSSSGKHFVCEL